jgi:Ni/Co efflux regulator RcnB
MKRILVPLLAALIASAPVAAAAQDRGSHRGRDRDDRREQMRQDDDGGRISVGQAVSRASAGRPGRFLGASERGGLIVVRWEYPGGRVADIMVDGRTGRVVGER